MHLPPGIRGPQAGGRLPASLPVAQPAPHGRRVLRAAVPAPVAQPAPAMQFADWVKGLDEAPQPDPDELVLDDVPTSSSSKRSVVAKKVETVLLPKVPRPKISVERSADPAVSDEAVYRRIPGADQKLARVFLGRVLRPNLRVTVELPRMSGLDSYDALRWTKAKAYLEEMCASAYFVLGYPAGKPTVPPQGRPLHAPDEAVNGCAAMRDALKALSDGLKTISHCEDKTRRAAKAKLRGRFCLSHFDDFTEFARQHADMLRLMGVSSSTHMDLFRADWQDFRDPSYAPYAQGRYGFYYELPAEDRPQLYEMMLDELAAASRGELD